MLARHHTAIAAKQEFGIGRAREVCPGIVIVQRETPGIAATKEESGMLKKKQNASYEVRKWMTALKNKYRITGGGTTTVVKNTSCKMVPAAHTIH
jgi:hypothetical protein